MFPREEASSPLAGVGEGLAGSILEGGGEEVWGLSMWFAHVFLMLLFLLRIPAFACTWCFLVQRHPLLHLTEDKPIFCQGGEGSGLTIAVQELGFVSTRDASVRLGSCLAGNKHRSLVFLQNASSHWTPFL